jgi:hypothetical protein
MIGVIEPVSGASSVSTHLKTVLVDSGLSIPGIFPSLTGNLILRQKTSINLIRRHIQQDKSVRAWACPATHIRLLKGVILLLVVVCGGTADSEAHQMTASEDAIGRTDGK